MAAKKLLTKVWRCGIGEVLLVHMRAASVALGSERQGFTNKHKNRIKRKRKRKRKSELDIEDRNKDVQTLNERSLKTYTVSWDARHDVFVTRTKCLTTAL